MMKIFLVLLLVGIAIASDVKVLTTQSFDAETASGEWLLEFYAPWCGHCKNLIPTYEELATKVKDQFNVAKIDCTIEKALQQRFGIRGFPTIKFLKDGKVYDYAGQRKVDAFVEFMNSGYSSAASVPLPEAVAAAPAAPAATAADSSKPSNVVTLTNSNFEELTSKDTWFLEFYAPWCGHCKRLAPIYEEVATELKGKIRVGKVNCDEEKAVCGQYGIKGYPTVYFKKNNELRSYNGQRTVDGFKKFADGGWESVTAEAVPEPVSVWKAKFYDLLGAVESGVSTNMWVIIGVCVVVGVLLGVVVIACTSGPQPTPKTIHYAAAPTSESDQVEDDSQPEEVANKDD